jgi:lactaldehyde dehydrogenase / glycolaldehyde dehydrogenase
VRSDCHPANLQSASISIRKVDCKPYLNAAGCGPPEFASDQEHESMATAVQTATNYQMYINGRWVASSELIDVINPATEEVFATTPAASNEQALEALEAARKAQISWGRITGVERGRVLRRWADLVSANRDLFARLIAMEVGKPLREAYGEVDFGNSWFRYYAEFDRRIEGEILPADRPDEQLWIVPQPAGVAVGIIAWNFPFAVAIRKIAPALIAGCSIVLKPHEDTPVSVLELMRLADEAGVPPGVCNVVTGTGATVGNALVRSDIPGVISFTGSVATGKAISRAAADNVTLVSLEMGGKAPFVVMDDCDIDAAVESAVFSRLLNCGQICIANERTYVHKRVADEFLTKFLARMKTVRVGNPLDEATQLGPKISRVELDKVAGYVDAAKQAGAKVILGGRKFEQKGEYERGYWFEPTVLTNVRQDMQIMKDEVFGPVLPVMEFDDFEEGLAYANDSKYGLAGYLFTNDMNKIMRAIRDMEVGELYINRGAGESIHGYHTGWKQSGIGGDDGKFGLEHYLRRKTVYLKYRG